MLDGPPKPRAKRPQPHTEHRPASPPPTVIPPPPGGYVHAGIDQFNWPHDPSCMVALPLSVPKSATTADKPEAEGAVKADAKVKVEVVEEEAEVEVEVESNVEDVAEEGTARNDVVELSVLDMSKTDIDLLVKGAALQMLTQRAGVKHDVEGNGTCWMYAVMAALRICEHAWCTPRARRPPTKLDIQWSQALLQAMKTHFLTLTVPRPTGRNQRDGSAAQDYAMIEERLGRQNVWVPSMRRATCLLYTSPSPRDKRQSRMPSSA